MNKFLLVILAIVLLSASAFRMRDETSDGKLADSCDKCFPNGPDDLKKDNTKDCNKLKDDCADLARRYKYTV